MSQKTVRYIGTTTEEAQQRYKTDSAEAAAAGWRVESTRWDATASQPTLVAEYVSPSQPRPLSPDVTPASPSEQEASRRRGSQRSLLVRLVVVGLLVIAVVAAYAVLTDDGGPGTSEELAGEQTAAPGVGKYQQTWATDYDATTCADFVQRMDTRERWVMAADYLHAAHQADDSEAPLPPDEQVDVMAAAMLEGCEGAAEGVGITTSEVAATLYTLSEELRP